MKRLISALAGLLLAGTALAGTTSDTQFSATGAQVDAFTTAISGGGGALFGLDDYRRVRILPQLGGANTGGSQTFQVQRVSSKSTDDWVVSKSWVLTNTTPSSSIMFNDKTSCTSNAGAEPGEVWCQYASINTRASSASSNHVAGYDQAVRAGLPASGVGVPILARVIEYHDFSGASSATSGQGRTLELDFMAAGADDCSNSPCRGVVTVALGKGNSTDASPHIGSLFGVYPNVGDGVTIGDGFHFESSLGFTGSLFKTKNAVQQSGAHAIWLGTGHEIAMDSNATTKFSSDGSRITATGGFVVTGSFQVDNATLVLGLGTSSPTLYEMRGAANSDRIFRFESGTTNAVRWSFGATNNDDLVVGRYTGSSSFQELTAQWSNATGEMTVRKGLTVSNGSALATSATTGLLRIGGMAGAPTGSVGSAAAPAVTIDTTNNKICWSTGGGTWKCALGS